jgi:hypothetical protein
MIKEVVMKIQTRIFYTKLQGLLEIFLVLFLSGFFGMYNYLCRCVDY